MNIVAAIQNDNGYIQFISDTMIYPSDVLNPPSQWYWRTDSKEKEDFWFLELLRNAGMENPSIS